MKILSLVAVLGFFLGYGQEQRTSIDPATKEVWTFEECLSYALDNNLNVLSAKLSFQSAEVNLKESKQSRLPSLSGAVSESFTNGTSIDPITSDFVNQQIWSTSVGLNTQVTLYQGSQLNNQIAQNNLLLNQNSFFVKAAENDVSLSILESYLQALYAKEAINVAENTLESSSRESEIAKARYEAGAIAKRDYADAVSQMATNQYNLIEAKNNYQAQVLMLKQMLELGPEIEFDIQEPDLLDNGAKVLEEKNEIFRTAMEIQPEIKASDLDVEVAEKDIQIAKGGYLPSLNLGGSVSTGYTNTQDLAFYDQFEGNFNQRVSLSLNIPIFSKGTNKAKLENAKIALEQAKISRQSEEKAMFEKIDTAWRNALAAQEQLSASLAAQDAAEQSYSLAQKQFDVGQISMTDLIVSQNTYTNSTQNYIQSKYLSILYSELLEFYKGNPIKL
ncbi:TolC family protein [Robertkochia solimangrovi]|nr:TolC family protein [Robertkochia solimangrovi]